MTCAECVRRGTSQSCQTVHGRRSMNLKNEIKNVEEIETLLYDVFQSACENKKAINLFITAAIKSQVQKSNSVEWAQIAQAICKKHYETFNDERVVNDRFVLSLAICLSEFYEEYLRRLQTIN